MDKMKKMKRFSSYLVLAFILCGVFVVGRVALARPSIDSRSFPVGEAHKARIEIHFGAGQLNVSGGSVELAETEFDYSNPRWRPEVTHSTTGGEGYLLLQHPTTLLGFFHLGPIRNAWDIKLNNTLPIELSIKMGAGRSNLKMGWLNLQNLDIKGGAGELVLDLTGRWNTNCIINVEMGVGSLHLILPDKAGVRLHPQTGIGTIDTGPLIQQNDAYINRHFEEADVILDISLKSGIGPVTVEQ